MRSTPKWNEELPLKPRAPLPPPRRFEIEVDGGKHVVAIKRVHFPGASGGPRVEKSQYEIKGTSLREDELIEHAADASKGALIVDARGGIHRPGETFLPRNKTMSIGDAFFPPTYVGENVPTFKHGRVISRAKLNYLARTGQLRKPPNMVNSFPSDRIRRRKRPFPPGLQREAIALVDPGAYHGLAIPPRAHVSAAFLGAALATGNARIAGDGSVYVRNEVGVFKKIGKVAKKGAKGVAKVAKPVAKIAVKPVAITAKVVAKPIPKAIKKPIAKVAKKTGKFVKKNAVPIAMTAALGPAGLAAYAGVKNRKKILNVAKNVGKWTGKQLAAAAKAVARVAATPIRLAVRPAVNAAVKKLAAGRPVTPQIKKSANALVIAQLKRNGNPLVKFSGTVLSYVGTGVSGIPSVGLALLKRDTARGAGMIVGCTQLRGQAPTVMGLTGAEISAMASAAVAALVPVVKKMVADMAVAKTQQVVQSALSPSTKAASQPPEVATTPADEPLPPDEEPNYPTAADYDNQSFPSAEQYEESFQPVEEPSEYAEAEDDSSGLISYGWAR